jgi:hypothetical protein
MLPAVLFSTRGLNRREGALPLQNRDIGIYNGKCQSSAGQEKPCPVFFHAGMEWNGRAVIFLLSSMGGKRIILLKGRRRRSGFNFEEGRKFL